MTKKTKKKDNTRFLTVIFVIGCFTYLTSIGRIDTKDYQAVVTMILGVYCGFKVFSKDKK